VTNADLARASAFEERLREACAERLVPSRFGTALFNDSLARVWSLNVLRVEAAPAGANELSAEAEQLQGGAGLGHRRVLVTDSDAGRELEKGFQALGWKTDAFVFMANAREPNRPVDTSMVVEVEREALVPVRDRIHREWMADADEETLRQMRESEALVAQAGNARHFAVLVDGAPVTATDLYSDGRTAQIEDVATLPEHRGAGYASAVVMRALAEALDTGHELVFLTADARDWPKELYRRLGFEPIGEKYAYLLHPVPAE
jgi:GNAT superfamily N-acetyltransferase